MSYKTALRWISKPIVIIASIVTILLIWRFMKWLGIRGMTGMATGMIIMTIAFLHPRMAAPITYLMELFQGKHNLLEIMRNDNRQPTTDKNTKSGNTTSSKQETQKQE